jgi:hypothetical protein
MSDNGVLKMQRVAVSFRDVTEGELDERLFIYLPTFNSCFQLFPIFEIME